MVIFILNLEIFLIMITMVIVLVTINLVASNGNGKTKHCDYHPTLTSHASANCVKNPANAKTRANGGNGANIVKTNRCY